MIFCINKNVKRLEVSLLSDRSACSPPKWTFITFNGCNNNYICYLWIFNVPETLPAFDSPSTPKSSNSSFGCSPGRRNSEKVFLFILMLTETSQQSCRLWWPWDRAAQSVPQALKHLQNDARTESQWVDSSTRRAAAGVNEGRKRWGLNTHVTCLPTVKEQLYMQAALNQTCIPPLTQRTQTHKLAHT